MKTSWNELRVIENYLSPDGEPADQVLFEARMILQPELKERVYWQKRTYNMIQQYGRQQLRSEIAKVHDLLFSAPEHRSFRQKMLRLFRK
ncbi:hypothetical protein [Pedobacter caeni]|uniref:Uncharacterized protein n=1 Tax=Pedobacter caeni TaxID=288992 RepID=A0A1M5GEJ3_9SPHI|nr:hypothetical protein [Pedobacter caeni]SHG02165.1 hypothetical protein SAMN04488522_104185 [Pedobacter caeni]